MAKYALLFLFSILNICLKSQSTEKLISIEDAAYDAYIANSKITIQGHFVNFKPEDLAGITIKYNVVVPLRKFENRETKINEDGTINQSGNFNEAFSIKDNEVSGMPKIADAQTILESKK